MLVRDARHQCRAHRCSPNPCSTRHGYSAEARSKSTQAIDCAIFISLYGRENDEKQRPSCTGAKVHSGHRAQVSRLIGTWCDEIGYAATRPWNQGQDAHRAAPGSRPIASVTLVAPRPIHRASCAGVSPSSPFRRSRLCGPCRRDGASRLLIVLGGVGVARRPRAHRPLKRLAIGKKNPPICACHEMNQGRGVAGVMSQRIPG